MGYSEWKKYKLGDIYDVFSGLSKSRDQFGFGNPFVTFKDVFDNYFLPTELTKLVNTNAKEIQSCSVKKGDIFLTRTSETQHELGHSSVALKDFPNATFNGFTKRLRLKKDSKVDIDLLYIGYYLRGAFVRNQIAQYSSLTTRASLNSSAINSINVFLPDISIQSKIGFLLKTLDDKIELNRQTNQTLEAIAQTLFKEMCVPKGEELLKEWGIFKLGDILEAKGGTTPSTKNADFWNGEFHWATPKDLSNLDTPVLLTTERKITQKGLKQISSGLFPKGTLLMSSRAPIGYFALSQVPVAVNQGFIAVNGTKVSNLFLLHWMKLNLEKIKSMGNGSIFLEISKTVFRLIEIVIPTDKILKEFEDLIKPIFEKIIINEQEIQTLKNFRDSLLPKLMKGKIKIYSKS